MASGIRISINLENCTGPLTVKDGTLLKLEEAIKSVKVSVCATKHHVFSDDTVTWIAILQESHVAVSTYLDECCVTVDVHMCHETQDNTELARDVGRTLADIFKAENVTESEKNWTSKKS